MKNVSSTSSFSLNEYYGKRSLLGSPLLRIPHIWECYSSSTKNTSRVESEKEKKENRGNGENTSNYIENMIILCRFFLLSLHKTFRIPHMLSWGNERRTIETVRVRSCFVEVRVIFSPLPPSLVGPKISLSSDTYFFHHINNNAHPTRSSPTPADSSHEMRMNEKLLCCHQHHPFDCV